MKVTEHLKKADKTLFSLEILPPKKGENINDLFRNIEPLLEFDPPFIDVTYHREEHVYRTNDGGHLEKKTVRKRPGTVGICAALMNKFNIDTVPHLICGGFTKDETENVLFDLDYLEIDNVLLLRGDSIKNEPSFVPHPLGHNYASELVKQVSDMNNGHHLDDNIADGHRSDFCIGVAGYPEKHIEAPSKSTDLKYLKHKVDQGADYIVTQMFFDNSKYFEFVENCRAIGIDVPIIPGLKPITSLRQITMLPKVFFLDLPDELVDQLDNCKTNKDVRKVGTAWCIKQSQELMEAKVPSLHYYSMGKSDPIYSIGKELF